MKKILVVCIAFAAICAVAFSATGCAQDTGEAQKRPSQAGAATAATTESADPDQAGDVAAHAVADDGEAASNACADENAYGPADAGGVRTGEVWQYAYVGLDAPITSAVCDELARIDARDYETADGMFPAVNILNRSDQSDGTVKVFGVFEIYNYRLADGVLSVDSAGSYTGSMTLSGDGSSYSVTATSFASDGSGFLESLTDICDGDSTLAGELANASVPMDTRLQFICDYVGEYGLPATTLRDSDGTTVTL